MKRLILLVFSVLYMSPFCFGQEGHYLKKDTSGHKKMPICIYKIPQQAPYYCTIVAGISPNDIDSARVYKKQQALALFGKKAKNGAIEIFLKPGVVLIDLDKLLMAHNINVSDQWLPIFIDSALNTNRQDLYFEPNAVRAVRINKEKTTGMRFLAIETVLGSYQGRKEENRAYYKMNN